MICLNSPTPTITALTAQTTNTHAGHTKDVTPTQDDAHLQWLSIEMECDVELHDVLDTPPGPLVCVVIISWQPDGVEIQAQRFIDPWTYTRQPPC